MPKILELGKPIIFRFYSNDCEIENSIEYNPSLSKRRLNFNEEKPTQFKRESLMDSECIKSVSTQSMNFLQSDGDCIYASFIFPSNLRKQLCLVFPINNNQSEEYLVIAVESTPTLKEKTVKKLVAYDGGYSKVPLHNSDKIFELDSNQIKFIAPSFELKPDTRCM